MVLDFGEPASAPPRPTVNAIVPENTTLVDIDALKEFVIELRTPDGQLFDTPHRYVRGQKVFDRFVFEIHFEAEKFQNRTQPMNNMRELAQLP